MNQEIWKRGLPDLQKRGSAADVIIWPELIKTEKGVRAKSWTQSEPQNTILKQAQYGTELPCPILT